ncbi:chromodomain-helicase-DNA-binding 8 isoform X3, putative [Babesia ovata]|uniref:Chromodomain-helicase-DNA-binding 8 isoform X3, putative n=1 Tax=Babesia ovata TaxID=189622 RepID=A0A2H6KC75_9APIC|nr:chromodomain-helicase-DNA-binding 8 isoform X3, putative [Babesia ovata]GBE60559.1 chromodomain-helicase-DNA-binding 8 isoform X3, putative [Babesia ovata]
MAGETLEPSWLVRTQLRHHISSKLTDFVRGGSKDLKSVFIQGASRLIDDDLVSVSVLCLITFGFISSFNLSVCGATAGVGFGRCVCSFNVVLGRFGLVLILRSFIVFICAISVEAVSGCFISEAFCVGREASVAEGSEASSPSKLLILAMSSGFAVGHGLPEAIVNPDDPLFSVTVVGTLNVGEASRTSFVASSLRSAVSSDFGWSKDPNLLLWVVPGRIVLKEARLGGMAADPSSANNQCDKILSSPAFFTPSSGGTPAVSMHCTPSFIDPSSLTAVAGKNSDFASSWGGTDSGSHVTGSSSASAFLARLAGAVCFAPFLPFLVFMVA